MATRRSINSARGKSVTHVSGLGRGSIATPGNYAQAPKPDKRSTDTTKRRTVREPVTCPGCGAQVKPVRAPFTNHDLGIVARTTFVYPNHRPGGGQYSAMRGDARCLASHEKESDQ